MGDYIDENISDELERDGLKEEVERLKGEIEARDRMIGDGKNKITLWMTRAGDMPTLEYNIRLWSSKTPDDYREKGKG